MAGGGRHDLTGMLSEVSVAMRSFIRAEAEPSVRKLRQNVTASLGEYLRLNYESQIYKGVRLWDAMWRFFGA